jgi:hypothetical protein
MNHYEPDKTDFTGIHRGCKQVNDQQENWGEPQHSQNALYYFDGVPQAIVAWTVQSRSPYGNH